MKQEWYQEEDMFHHCLFQRSWNFVRVVGFSNVWATPSCGLRILLLDWNSLHCLQYLCICIYECETYSTNMGAVVLNTRTLVKVLIDCRHSHIRPKRVKRDSGSTQLPIMTNPTANQRKI